MKYVLVKENYGGVLTQEQRILPGEYDVEDERLFGLADILVERGIAVPLRESDAPVVVPVEAQAPAIETDAQVEAELTSEVDSRTNAQLKAELDELGVAYKATATKSDLLAALAEHGTDPE